jgi:hypothetical protein
MRLEEPEIINYEDYDLDEEHMDSLVDLGGVDYGDEILNLLRAMLSTDPNNRKFSYTCIISQECWSFASFCTSCPSDFVVTFQDSTERSNQHSCGT